MFSKFELAIIEVDISHILKSVSLDDKQTKIRESIVKKISLHDGNVICSCDPCDYCKMVDDKNCQDVCDDFVSFNGRELTPVS